MNFEISEGSNSEISEKFEISKNSFEKLPKSGLCFKPDKMNSAVMANKNDLLAVLQVLKKYNLKVNYLQKRSFRKL